MKRLKGDGVKGEEETAEGINNMKLEMRDDDEGVTEEKLRVEGRPGQGNGETEGRSPLGLKGSGSEGDFGEDEVDARRAKEEK